ncbi:MAG: choice-of-anchor N protein [Rhodobacteraceae bacterium]|nr:choice-of-anchor N protein [Paracoccaceae bacterium]
MNKKIIGILAAVIGITNLASQSAYAIPMLQLFIESEQGDGSIDQNTYWDPDTQTWARVGNTPFYVWGVVKTSSPTRSYTWSQLNFTAVGPSNYFDADLSNGVFSATATGVGGTVGGFTVSAGPNFGVSTDPANPLPSGYMAPTAAGTDECCGPAFTLPSHGEYGNGLTWAYWDLLGGGTLSGGTAPLGQFQPDNTTEPFFDNGFNYPDPITNQTGYIFRYYVNPIGLAPSDIVHFDLWGYVNDCDPGKKNCEGYYFAPFSHDAQWQQAEEVPVPGALALFGLGLVGIGAALRRRG